MNYPCPCCGFLTFDELPGSYNICMTCNWEDDMFQLKFPNLKMGPNKVSLIEAQENYKRLAVSDPSLKKYVRKATVKDKRDPQWRPIDTKKDKISNNDEFKGIAQSYEWENNLTSLYYWKIK